MTAQLMYSDFCFLETVKLRFLKKKREEKEGSPLLRNTPTETDTE